MRDQGARIVARLKPDGGGVRLAEEGFERDRWFLVGVVRAEAQCVNHRSPP